MAPADISDVKDVEAVLRSKRPPVRQLHEIWQQRQSIPEPAALKAGTVLGRQIEWIQSDLRLCRRFVERAYETREYRLVCDAAGEMMREWAEKNSTVDFLRLRMCFASALARLGDIPKANQQLRSCLEQAPGELLRAEIHQQLGDVRREEWALAGVRAARMQAAEEALSHYRLAHELNPESLDAILWQAACTLYVAGKDAARREQARGFAQQLSNLARQQIKTAGPLFEIHRALAEALTLLGQEDEALAAYQALQGSQDCTFDGLADARYRTRFFADALGKPLRYFDKAFPPLQLVVFSGHMADRATVDERPGRVKYPSRFPSEQIDAVRELLRLKLAELNACRGMASAAAGADLLFLDELGKRADSLYHVVLPWSEQEFRQTSVEKYDPPAYWKDLFDKAAQRAASLRELGEFYQPDPSSNIGWDYMLEVQGGLALNTARMLQLDVQPLVLWDRQPGRGHGGTADFVQFWEQLGYESAVLDMPKVGSALPVRSEGVSARRAERPVLHQEVKSMLFADIVGYSKFKEKAIPNFVTCFLDRVSQLAAASPHAPQSVATWGDAIYAVFDFAADAGNFALELTRMIHENRDEWMERELFWTEPAPANEEPIKRALNIRIGLHTGPVLQHYNPLMRQLGFTGAHVSRAARIEPVTIPGEVYASEEFAALVELDAAIRYARAEKASMLGKPPPKFGGKPPATFVCEYAGSMALAKGYPGRYRIYRLNPTQRLDIEELAKAIHESYCEEARKRNETVETNAALQRWEELAEDKRDANRAQAADIRNKLGMLGYELTVRGGIDPADMLLPTERVEAIAQHEHLRWMAERRRDGWIYAEKRDDALKHHNLLVEWDLLNEDEKDKDRVTVRNLPIWIARAGFRVRKAD